MRTAVWTVPRSGKAGKEHRVPLSKAALTVVNELAELRQSHAAAALIFPDGKGATSNKPLSNTAMLMLLRRMERGDLTVNGFRSTFRDWCAEATNYPRELAEAALAHALDSKVEAAYQRGDLLEKRRRLMTDWAAFCARPIAADGDNVTALRVSEAVA